MMLELILEAEVKINQFTIIPAGMKTSWEDVYRKTSKCATTKTQLNGILSSKCKWMTWLRSSGNE